MKARAPGFIGGLEERVRGKVRVDEPLARYSTWRIGGPATLLQPADPEDAAAALRYCHETGVGWFALGLGSNILLPDEGMEVLVLRLGKGIDGLRQDGARWWIGAGLPAPLAARRTAQAGWAGLHTMVGVPGTVGGGVYMNAGCHGAEWAGVTRRVTVLDGAGGDRVLERHEIPFAYRTSGIANSIVVEAEVELVAEDPRSLNERVADLFRWRQEGTPFNQPCCGSTFRNPGGVSGVVEGGPRTAGQLIDAAGCKGVREGGIEVSPMHANYFVNSGGGSAEDARRLIRRVQQAVQERLDVRLETEVKIIGPDGRYHSP